MKQIISCLAFLLFLATGGYAQKSAQLNWLAGTWKINTGNGSVVEQWQVVNDSTLRGKSVFVKNQTDTLPQETIELAYRNGDWYYIPLVANQNNGLPVRFKIILLKGAEFISENPVHDFPQRIAYRRIKNQLFAHIEGRRKGVYEKQNFDFNLE